MGDDYASFAADYDACYADRTQDVTYYAARACESDGLILEVGCGTGRVTIPLARTGREVHGLDASPAMLRILGEKLAAQPQLAVRLHQGDMRNFTLEQSFAQVFVPFRAFLHMDTIDDQLAALGTFRRHLAAEGRLILDVFAPSYDQLSRDQLDAPVPTKFLHDGRVITAHDYVRYSHGEQHLEIERHLDHIAADGCVRRKVERFHLRYVFRYEMELLLRLAGFHLETVHGGFDGRPYDYHSGEMIFTARPA
jgi:SAM-dependent methyltransferase